MVSQVFFKSPKKLLGILIKVKANLADETRKSGIWVNLNFSFHHKMILEKIFQAENIFNKYGIL